MLKEASAIFEEVIAGIDKEAKDKELADKVYKYLASDYPKDTLTWVKKGDWYRGNIPLEEIKMARRPGGRESKKTEALQKLYEKGEKVDPVVLVKNKKGEYIIADGYHRTLARKKAGYDTIEAYVTEREEDSGPWIVEMHDKKISQGVKTIKETFQKESSVDYGYSALRGAGVPYLNKEAKFAAFGKGVKQFGKNFLGTNKRQARQQLDQAKKFRNMNKTNFFGKKDPMKSMGNNMGKKMVADAKQNYKNEKRKTFGARAAVGGGVLGAMGVNKAVDNFRNQPSGEEFKQQREELQQQQEALKQQL